MYVYYPLVKIFIYQFILPIVLTTQRDGFDKVYDPLLIACLTTLSIAQITG